MISIPQLATYISYVFIVLAYGYKVWKVARMPVHLRWDLYPMPFGKGHEYGGSYLEEKEWWKKPLPKNGFGGIFHMIKKYLFFGGYFKLKRDYWISLYPWHIGFYFIVGFHVLTFFCALLMVTAEVGCRSRFDQCFRLHSLLSIFGSISYRIHPGNDRQHRDVDQAIIQSRDAGLRHTVELL